MIGPVPGRLRLGRRHEFSDLDELMPAYAISVHKSQGNEYPAVIVPLVGARTAVLTLQNGLGNEEHDTTSFRAVFPRFVEALRQRADAALLPPVQWYRSY